jgi:hypothetical protein
MSERGPLIVKASAAHQQRFIVSFEGVETREDAEHCAAWCSRAAALRRRRDLDRPALRRRGLRRLGRARGVVTEVEANPASDLLVLDSGAPGAPDLRHPRRGPTSASTSTSPRASSNDAARRRAHPLPRGHRPVRHDLGARTGEAKRRVGAARARHARRHRRRAPQRRRHALRRGSGHGPARRADHAHARDGPRPGPPVDRADAVGTTVHPRGRPRTERGSTASRCSAVATRASTSAPRPGGRRGGLPGRLRAGRRGAGGAVRDRGGGAPAPGALGNDESTMEESFADGCSSTRTTPSPPRCAATRCPRSCAPATTSASRAGAARSRCGARSSAVPT